MTIYISTILIKAAVKDAISEFTYNRYEKLYHTYKKNYIIHFKLSKRV